MKTALVTGASSGIGREVAKGLARSGHHVVLLSRDPVRSAAALEEVRGAAAPGVAVVNVTADLSSLADVRRAAADVKRHAERLELLVNCAAVVPTKRIVTPEGFESAFATNVLAPLVLVHELKGFLTKAAPARVVNFFGGNEKKLDFDDLQSEQGRYDGWRAYGRSKLCVALLTIELARRLVAVGVTANAAWPGIVNTEGIRAMQGVMGLMMLLWRPLMRTPEAGAATPLWLCTEPALERVSGKCFGSMFGDGRKELQLPPAARDLEAAKRLYETCERLAKL
jgi:NAD(P)-dependent dehydrogenase (short-subunit alcohol dehydrogenase family)